jgi:hypothetical protein
MKQRTGRIPGFFVFLGCKTEGKRSQIVSDDMFFLFYFLFFLKKWGWGEDGIEKRDKRQE